MHQASHVWRLYNRRAPVWLVLKAGELLWRLKCSHHNVDVWTVCVLVYTVVFAGLSDIGEWRPWCGVCVCVVFCGISVWSVLCVQSFTLTCVVCAGLYCEVCCVCRVSMWIMLFVQGFDVNYDRCDLGDTLRAAACDPSHITQPKHEPNITQVYMSCRSS